MGLILLDVVPVISFFGGLWGCLPLVIQALTLNGVALFLIIGIIKLIR